MATCMPTRVPGWSRRGRVGIMWLRRAWSDPASQKRRYAPRPARLSQTEGDFPDLARCSAPICCGEGRFYPKFSRSSIVGRVWSVGSGVGWKGGGWWRSGPSHLCSGGWPPSPWGLQVVVILLGSHPCSAMHERCRITPSERAWPRTVWSDSLVPLEMSLKF